MDRVQITERVLLTAVAALIGAAPGAFMWAWFAGNMSKNPVGWPEVIQSGLKLVQLTGWPAFGVSWFVSWLVNRRPPQWWLALVIGIAFGVIGLPLMTFVAYWVADVLVG